MSAHVASPVFAGRQEQTARLAAGLALAVEGDPVTVLLRGESGIGKSRLVAEFLRTHAGRARVLLGTGGEPGTPFAAFAGIVRGLAPDLIGDERDRLAPLLAGQQDPRPRHDDARLRLFETVLALLARLAARRATVLVVEDAHEADRSSLDLLAFLVRSQRAAPGSLIVATSRSGEPATLADLGVLPWVEPLDLTLLRQHEVAAQVGGILGRQPDPEHTRTVFRRSTGHPLFVEALLDGDPATPARCSLPDLLLTRIARLPEDTRHVLRLAALGGARAGHALLAACHPDPAAALRPAVDAGVLLADGGDYVFRHALLREACRAGLPPGERAALHARHAEALRARSGPPGALAHHLGEAGDEPGALSAAWEAARHARDHLAYPEELAWLERVLALWERVPGAARRLGHDRADVLAHAVLAARRSGEDARGERHATDALAALGDRARVRRAPLLEQRAHLRARLGIGGALDDLNEAVRLVPTGHPARGRLLHALAEHLAQLSIPGDARRIAEQARQEAHEAGDAAAEASALITLAELGARLGHVGTELPKLATARALAEGIGAHRLRLRALHTESSLLREFGRLTEAQDAARLGLAAAREAGLACSAGARHALDLACAQAAAGRWAEALETVQHALAATEPGADHTALLCLKAQIALWRGHTAEAASIAGRARRRLPGAALPRDRLLLPPLDAEILLAQDRPGEARRVIGDALASEHSPGPPHSVWPLLLTGARVAGAAGDMRLLDRLRVHADRTRIAGPAQRAAALTFEAETCRAERQPDGPCWERAVAAWQALGQPRQHAQALLRLGQARFAAGERGPAVQAPLREAAELARGLGAAPLLAQARDLARRGTG
ncbi:ATP-binding protein [Prauserella muralis]|uniref:Orc1-like AAA ATPase domain-containing protein n=1 Tax=Prauserella muralis TaxID=588067 RepID=A0A2V4B142_9PSEU|nr:AAA family ATPase [Prauserella muralis]PXY27991.1 hypothetical protein BAY60_16730 [Prauserella muralis]TWE22220.1 AAA ATPase-like protein [Prauserella muralis]